MTFMIIRVKYEDRSRNQFDFFNFFIILKQHTPLKYLFNQLLLYGYIHRSQLTPMVKMNFYKKTDK